MCYRASMPAPVEVIALDLMDTVVEDPFFSEVPGLLGVEGTPQVVALLDPDVWIAFESGTIDEETYLDRMFRPGAVTPVTAQQVRQTILDGYRFLPGLEALLEGLCTREVPLWALSNYSPWIDHMRRALELDRFFEGYVVSCRTGLRKPDARAYEALVARCGAAAGRCLMVDDRASNVEGAQAAGLRAIRFDGVEGLRVELTRLGLI